jgi:hypothetical protein
MKKEREERKKYFGNKIHNLRFNNEIVFTSHAVSVAVWKDFALFEEFKEKCLKNIFNEGDNAQH